MTFFGQFMDLDVTFDSRSPIGVPTEPSTMPNARMAAFDLDTIYGQGPNVNALYYDANDTAKLGRSPIFCAMPSWAPRMGSLR